MYVGRRQRLSTNEESEFCTKHGDTICIVGTVAVVGLIVFFIVVVIPNYS